MSVERYHLDSNILLRFFTGEPVGQFTAASALIERAANGFVILDLSPLVLAETAFTLESYYRKPRKEVAGALAAFIQRSGVRLGEKDRMLDALKRVSKTGVHFVDAYLAACAAESGMAVASFDRDLDRFKDVKRYEPAG